MKLSKLIVELNYIMQTNGDLEVDIVHRHEGPFKIDTLSVEDNKAVIELDWN